MLGSNHNKLWDTKCKTHGWSERALLLFKVMHFLEKATHMITYFEKGFLIIQPIQPTVVCIKFVLIVTFLDWCGQPLFGHNISYQHPSEGSPAQANQNRNWQWKRIDNGW